MSKATSVIETSSIVTSLGLDSTENNDSRKNNHNPRAGATAVTETGSSSAGDDMPSHLEVRETLQSLKMQIGDLSKARKDMKKIIEKQEAQREILGMPLLADDYGQLVGE